jgi:hypothetical protein
MRCLRRIQVLDNELPSSQISYQTKLRKCFDSKYQLVCEELNRQVVGLLSVDAKTLRLVLLYDRLGISKVLVLYRRGLVFLLRINLLFLLLPYLVLAVLLHSKSGLSDRYPMGRFSGSLCWFVLPMRWYSGI